MGLISNGTTVFDAGAMSAGFGGSLTLIKKLTADGSTAGLSFVHGSANVVFNSTFKQYMFTFNNLHPSSNENKLVMQTTIDGTNFNVATTTTFMVAYNRTSGGSHALEYDTSKDVGNSTSFYSISEAAGSDNDQSVCGFMHFFNPADTTFVKIFWLRTSTDHHGDFHMINLVSGYINTTSAITGVQFKYENNTMDAGDICLYGIA